MTIHRGHTTRVLQLTAKKYIYKYIPRSVFYTGKINHNHELSLSIECGNHRLNSNIVCVVLKDTPPSCVSALPSLAVLSRHKKHTKKKKKKKKPHFIKWATISPKTNPFLLELARNTCFTSTQPLYSSLVGVNCKIVVNRFSECVRGNACEAFGLVTH